MSKHGLVAEMMIMAGEAIGKWKLFLDKEAEEGKAATVGGSSNTLRLAFRSQPKPGASSIVVE